MHGRFDKRAVELWSTTRLSVAVIAHLTAMSTTRVYALVHKFNAVRPPKPAAPPKEPKGKRKRGPELAFGSNRSAKLDRKEINARQKAQRNAQLLKLWNEGLDTATIAERLLITENRVCVLLKEAGVNRKAPRICAIGAEPSTLLMRSKAEKKVDRGYWWRRT